MADHQGNATGEECSFGSDKTVADPASGESAQVDRGAIGTQKCGGLGAFESEAAVGGCVVEVVGEDGLHAIEAESLPHFDADGSWHGERVSGVGFGGSLRT